MENPCLFHLNMKRLICLILAGLLLILPSSACAPKEKTPLVVFAAGSLMKPFSDLEKAFESANPDIDVRAEYHGSIQVMRHVTDLHEDIDLVATADLSLIPQLMYAVNDPDTGKPYADWAIAMASNKLSIAYTPESKYASEINAENWWEVLSRPDVKVGLSDPRFDAVGYRMMMVFALAQKETGRATLFDDFLQDQFQRPVRLIDLGDQQIIRIPELLETTANSRIMMRGSSVALIALLQSGEVDYAFEYDSVIRQHGFERLELPDSLNLGNPDFEVDYASVTVRLDFKRFKTVDPVFKGELIRYGLTIPSSAPNPDAATRFIQFLYSEAGQKVMQDNYHPLILPLTVDHPELLPPALQEMTGR